MSDPIFRNQPKVADQSKKDDDLLPEPLRGKSAAEVYNALKAEHIREMAETQQNYTTRLESLAMQPSSQPAAQPATPQPQVQPQAEPEFDISNPDAYLDVAVNKRVAPIIQGMVASGRAAGQEIIKGKLKENYDRFGKEIEAFVDSVSPQMQANPKIYEIAWNFVKGQHADELIEEGTKSKLTAAVREALQELGFEPTPEAEARLRERQAPAEQPRPSLFQRSTIPSTSVPRSGVQATRPTGKGKLSSEERAMCEKFEMSEEEYLKYKEENTDIYSALGRERA